MPDKELIHLRLLKEDYRYKEERAEESFEDEKETADTLED